MKHVAEEVEHGAGLPKQLTLRHVASGRTWDVPLKAVVKDGMQLEVNGVAAAVAHRAWGARQQQTKSAALRTSTPAAQRQGWGAVVDCLGLREGELLRLELVVDECSAERLVATVESG